MSGSNMYGYSDYHGPKYLRLNGAVVETASITGSPRSSCDTDDQLEENHNPLQVGFWMEGDSLAPPCGSSISTIHALLQFANVTSDDILYDLGCGDARICLEAFALHRCQTFGVEIEDDLVQRANTLIGNLASQVNEDQRQGIPRVLKCDLRDVLHALVTKAKDVFGCPTDMPNDEPLSNEADVLTELTELRLPTLLVMYLLPDAIDLIRDDLILLLKLLPSTFRILCNTWGIKSLQKTNSIEIQEVSSALTSLMLYTRQSLE
ncbi:hypothetical protein MPSEU_000652000 [Mayamaea pseudoterrestris]|nr:hypothetical protein MPSEU_000652000 [Mayamaea pseudoterrestris]